MTSSSATAFVQRSLRLPARAERRQPVAAEDYDRRAGGSNCAFWDRPTPASGRTDDDSGADVRRPASPAQDDLTTAIAEYESIRALLDRVDASGIWFRDRSPINTRMRPRGRVIGVERDRVMAALFNKAVATHKSIRILVDADCATDAMALARVLVENGVVFVWILMDEETRIDAYWASHSVHQQREALVVAEYYEDSHPELVRRVQAAAESSAPLAMILGGSHHQWARTFNENTGQFVSLSAFQLFEEAFKQPAHTSGGDR